MNGDFGNRTGTTIEAIHGWKSGTVIEKESEHDYARFERRELLAAAA